MIQDEGPKILLACSGDSKDLSRGLQRLVMSGG